ncbi:MAG: phosphoribosyltransferase family protein [Porphyromonas sp.]|nr:phosphoribosyltransferase family protein [Porphyromonas sp.]
MRRVGTHIKRATDFLLPSYCIECDSRLTAEEQVICGVCFDRMPLYRGAVERFHKAHQRLAGHLPFTEYRSDLIFTPDNTARALIHQIKYNGQAGLGERLARHFATYHWRDNHFMDVTAIVPVPLTRSRQRRRGYNQSVYIAHGIAETYHLPLLEDALARKEHRGTQTRRSPQRRWEALSEQFFVPDAVDLVGRRLLLVDDVLTTGATLVHAGQALLRAGAESVSFYTLAVDVLL